MASVYMSQPFHHGEQEMHRLLKVPEHDNPTAYALTPQASFMLQRAPLLALGALDSESRPWTTLLGGEVGFSQQIGGNVIGVRTDVDAEFDPVIESLIPKDRRAEGEVVKTEGQGAMVGGLTIDLMSRKRVKIAGRMIAGAVSIEDGGEDEGRRGLGEMQLVCKIEQSLGNCPKYLNKKDIRPAPAQPKLLSKSQKLPPEALALLNKADLFFISSSNAASDMDTNHRGGPPGFIRLISNNSDGAEIIYPEYSGNRLYQTLGNLITTPLAGIVIPDFDTGDVLYATCKTSILIGADAAALLPRSNLAVKLKITEARFITQGLPFRGIAEEFSPYNPNIRLLPNEGNIVSKLQKERNTAKLLSHTVITPTISRYKFAMTNPIPYQPGQWVALDFSAELDIGYSHMRDDDPQSLNDDFVRTFTVSSLPLGTDAKPHDEFEITVRQHGPVTILLSRTNSRSSLKIPLKGFGGDFVIKSPSNGEIVPFIAGGVGITPVLGQLPSIDLSNFRLFWIIQFVDVDFVLDVLRNHPGLAENASIFFTGDANEEQADKVQAVRDSGPSVIMRRPEKQDFDALNAETWYLCAGQQFRGRLLEWLEGKTVLFENFDY